MSIPLFFEPVTYLKSLRLSNPITIAKLCEMAGVRCKASGPWAKRKLEIVSAEKTRIVAEPGDWGQMRVELSAPANIESSEKESARLALTALAYGINDLVAKESIRGESWAKVKAPPGRMRSGTALSNAERQRRFRRKKRRP